MSPETESSRLQRLAQQSWAGILILIVMLPSLYWISNDHHVWAWDQSWYGEVSVDLWFRLTHAHRFSKWASAMVTAFGTKSPGIAWFGQFFVPFGTIIGSTETGLLSSVIAAQIGSIALFYQTAKELAPGRRLIAAAGILIFAGAPLFLAMSHQYVAEPLQLLGVTYFYFLAATGHRMARVTLLGNLLFAMAIALLAKMTSPIYCFLPGLIATYAIFKKRDAAATSSRVSWWPWFCLIVGLVSCGWCAAWYIHNLPALRETLRLQTSLDFTINYGKAGTFFEKLGYWFRALQANSQLPWVIGGQIILVGVGVGLAKFSGDGVARSPRDEGRQRFNLLAIFSVIHILTVLCICSSNYNEEHRYLLPLLPAVGTVNLWLICKIRQPWLVAAVVLLLSAQWAGVCMRAFGIGHLDDRTCAYWIIPMDPDREKAGEIARVVHDTADPVGTSRINMCGIELPWINDNNLSFFAAKEQLKTGRRCYYTSLGYGAKDVEPAWKRMMELKSEYFISLEEAAQPPEPNFLNEISIPILRRIRDDPDFVQQPFSSKLGIVIFHKKMENSGAEKPGSPAQ